MKKLALGFTIILVLGFVSFKFTSAYFTSTVISTDNTFITATVFPKTANLYVSDPFTCAGGASITSESKGSVTINNDGNLNISVNLNSALPNSTYQLWVNQHLGACPPSTPTIVEFINTDLNGNGSGTLINHPIISGATNFWVSLVSGSSVLRSTAISF